jgi:hypothetical protein
MTALIRFETGGFSLVLSLSRLRPFSIAACHELLRVTASRKWFLRIISADRSANYAGRRKILLIPPGGIMRQAASHDEITMLAESMLAEGTLQCPGASRQNREASGDFDVSKASLSVLGAARRPPCARARVPGRAGLASACIRQGSSSARRAAPPFCTAWILDHRDGVPGTEPSAANMIVALQPGSSQSDRSE